MNLKRKNKKLNRDENSDFHRGEVNKDANQNSRRQTRRFRD